MESLVGLHTLLGPASGAVLLGGKEGGVPRHGLRLPTRGGAPQLVKDPELWQPLAVGQGSGRAWHRFVVA